jgi:hypothetical protein
MHSGHPAAATVGQVIIASVAHSAAWLIDAAGCYPTAAARVDGGGDCHEISQVILLQVESQDAFRCPPVWAAGYWQNIARWVRSTDRKRKRDALK